MRETFIRAAKNSGADFEREPTAAKVLDGSVSPEEARVLFPRKPTRADKARATALGTIIDAMKASDDLAVRNSLLAESKRLMAQSKGDGTLRLDSILQVSERKRIFIDNGSVHSSAASVRDAQLKYLVENVSARGRKQEELPPTPAIARRITVKVNKYRPLVQRAVVAAASRHEVTDIIFRALIVSHLGEMSGGLFETVEDLAVLSKKRAFESPPWSGDAPKTVSCKMRRKTKDALMTVVAKGVGRLIEAVGHPSRAKNLAGFVDDCEY